MVRSSLQKRFASALLLTTIAVQLQTSGALAVLQNTPVFEPFIGMQNAEAQQAPTFSMVGVETIRAFANQHGANIPTAFNNAGAVRLDPPTLFKLCNLAGYSNVTSWNCTHPGENRCNYTSCGDNTLHGWNGASWVGGSSCGGSWVAQFSCDTPIVPTTQCNDNVDNDGDGLKDFPADPGCANAQDNDEYNQVSCPAARTTATFEGRQGPWEDVAPSGDATPPTFVSNVQAGGTVKFVSANGTYSARMYGGQDQLPLTCDNGTLSFTNNSNQTLSKVKLNAISAQGVTVPNGATRAYLSHDEPGSFNYFDNSGNRDRRTPCSVTLDITPNSCQQAQCQDGLDNDGDGLVDFPNDPGCVNAQDNDESPRNVPTLDVEKYLNGTLTPGQNATYTITVRNTGTIAAQNVNVYDYFLDNQDIKYMPFTFVSSTGISCAYQSGAQQISCPVGSIAAGQTVTMTLTFAVPTNQACNLQIRNRADAWMSGQQSGSDVDDVTSNVQCPAQCQNGIDDDFDGQIDFPADQGCTSAQDNDETNAPLPQCQNGIDDDGDGRVDFPNDPGCNGPTDTTEGGDPACADRVDNDNDGLVDFPNDPGCTSLADTDETNGGLPQCRDGIDNDGDGAVDALVNSTTGIAGGFQHETATPKYGKTWLVSITCRQANGQNVTYNQGGNSHNLSNLVRNAITAKNLNITPPSSSSNAIVRSDGGTGAGFEWNDNSGTVHMPTVTAVCQILGNPSDTYVASTCRDNIREAIYPNGRCNFHSPGDNQLSRFVGSVPASACSDGVDNDGDGLRDFPQDNGCASANDASEVPHDPQCTDPNDPTEADPLAQCQDGIDNDGDGATDFPNDFSCSSPTDTDETNPRSACQDGIDNDNDGLTDFPQDPGCTSRQDNDESNSSQCSDGIDNDGDGAVDLQDFSCSSPTDNDETNPRAACQDGFDNDGDGLTDFPQDPGCASRQDNDESNAVTTVDLSISKTGPASIVRGQTLTYTITVANASNAAQATNVVVTDAVPAGLVYNDGASYVPCTLSGNQVSCPIGILPAGVSGSFNISFDVPTIVGCTQAVNISNSATISSSQTDSNQGNNVATQSPSLTRVDCPIQNQCQDGIDNDQDGRIDFPADPGCSSPTDTNEGDDPACADRIDNDGDGLVDFPQDPGCTSLGDTDEFNQAQTIDLATQKTGPASVVRGQPILYTLTVRNNGLIQATNLVVTDQIPAGLVYNDALSHSTCSQQNNAVVCTHPSLGVGQTGTFTVAFDTPSLPNCTAPVTIINSFSVTAAQQDSNPANNTTSTVASPTRIDCPVQSQCQDGIDNDNDGAIDFPADFSCSSPTDTDEANPRAACQDGIDNDGDLLVDYPLDPGCSSLQDNDELNSSQCQDGIDNDGDGAIDLQDFSCSTPTDNDETNPKAQCQDGIDNDQDGAVDFPLDPGCQSRQDNDEFNAPSTVDLSIQKTGPASVTRGQPVFYTVSIANLGQIQATNVVITDAIPAGLSYNDALSFGPCSQVNNQVVCTQSTLAPNQFGSFTIAFDTPALQACTPTNVVNTITISATQTDSNQSNNTSTTLLSPTRIDCPIQNQCQDGIDNDQDGRIDFPADPGCSSPTDTNEGDDPACADRIDNDGDNLIDFPFDPGCQSLGDTDESNQVQTVDLSITKTGPATIVRGQTIFYTIQIGNAGTAQATNVVVTDNVPAGLVYNDALSYGPCSQVAGQILCTQSTLAPNQFGSFIVAFDFPVVQGCTPTTISNTATIRADQTEGQNTQGNNTSSASTAASCPQSNACSDFNDNDGDGRIDFPADPGCSSPTDTNEGDDPACADRIDNDGDGLVDFPQDPGCTSLGDTDESNAPVTQCRDGIDNDGDGRIDTNDAGCANGDDTNEGDGPADLAITLTGPSTVQGGSTASYVATVVNNGPDAATSPFSIRVAMPNGVGFNAGLSSQGCAQQNAFVVCSGITLGAFQQTSRTVVFNIPSSGFGSATVNSLINLALGIETAQAQAAGICNTTIQVVANVVPVQPDPNQGNNQSQAVNTFVSCQAAAQCQDGIDNDGDGRIDFPLDPGCSSATDTNEGDDPVQFGCIDIVKETYDPHGNRLPIDAQFTFILDATRVAYNNAQGRARFEQVTPGQHAVAEIIPSGWTQLSVSPQNGAVNVTAGANCATVTFRNRQVFVANAQCADGYDNDGDGLTDFPLDTGCTSATDNDEFNNAFVPQCRDGVDNDGDGLTDFPADQGCANVDDNNEVNGQPLVAPVVPPVAQTTACNDGVDNDGDGLTDFPADQGCASATDTDEFNFRAPRCSDGIDNDGDGATDFPADQGCTTASDDNEWNNRLIIDRWREFWNWNW